MMIFPQKCGILNETPVRERLKEEITTLTDRQAEIVGCGKNNPCDDYEKDPATSLVANQAMQQPQWRL